MGKNLRVEDIPTENLRTKEARLKEIMKRREDALTHAQDSYDVIRHEFERIRKELTARKS